MGKNKMQEKQYVLLVVWRVTTRKWHATRDEGNVIENNGKEIEEQKEGIKTAATTRNADSNF